ncbi:MAG: 3-hydroxybutyryl-CoA dehydrogenase [Dehalococcoidia bacterium]
MTRMVVVGAGLMGSGIAQVAARAGLEVKIRDIDDRLVEGGLNSIEKNLEQSVARQRITEDEAKAVMARITGVVDLAQAAKEADIIIEAITENMEVKKELFTQLDKLCPAETIFASNTSSLSITEMASATQRAPRFVGMHFFNPVPAMKLVEVVRGYGTSQDTVDAARELAERMGKTPIEAKDSPGFIVNRLLVPMINEALYLLMEGVASAEDIDQALVLGANHPMGPLTLLDLIGLDTQLAVMNTLYTELGDPKYRPCPLNRKLVRARRLGRKAGKGVYDYTQ